MKYLRILAVSIVMIVFIAPLHVLVTLSTDEDQYRKFKHDTQDRVLEMLWDWAYGRLRKKEFNAAGIFNA